MVFLAVKGQWVRGLLVGGAITLLPAACADDDPRPDTVGSLETGGRAGAGGDGATSGAAGTTGGAAGTGATDAGPCGAEFEACCGGPHGSCAVANGVICDDAACVSCARVPAPMPGCVNVAPAGTATANLTRPPDQAAPDYGPARAIDENVCKVWASGDYAVNPETAVTETWWQLDLGAPKQLSGMTLWLAMTPAGPVDLRVEHSLDGVTWKTIWSGERAMSGHAPWLHAFPQPITTRHVAIMFLASPSWVSIRELALFQCPLQ
jgi:hypothetical protein